ncbi:hypothetical protein DFH08DRAFT_771720 [Mycena albidolilacea]|uniref:Homeobox domain-containing protein n=1 Tax=Mycena albidolilacea TaxID=1033008 RepID=A0AAD7EYS9_9AGAR|nr:hypothetical protein DFH08DRAFT_771720 [Mycena albidolilacea]
MKTSLDVLAAAATSCYDSHDYNSSPSSPSSSLSSLGGSPLAYYDSHNHSPSSRRSSRPKRPSAGSCNADQPRPRKQAHKSCKSLRPQLKPSPELKVRRKELMDRACGIDSLSNSPANECQLFLLKTVFDEITMYPTEAWLALMAIILHRSLRQIRNWFSNERQKNRWGDVVTTHTDVGERLRLRPSAIELCQQWSDTFFEEVLMIVNYRTTRRLQWERAQAMNKSAVTTVSYELDAQRTDPETPHVESEGEPEDDE